VLWPACGSREKPSATGTFAPGLTVHTGRGTTGVAELMPTVRPVLPGLAGRRARAARRALLLARSGTPHETTVLIIDRPSRS
jgi:hypothetical protein